MVHVPAQATKESLDYSTTKYMSKKVRRNTATLFLEYVINIGNIPAFM
jgi:hypothetical protein